MFRQRTVNPYWKTAYQTHLKFNDIKDFDRPEQLTKYMMLKRAFIILQASISIITYIADIGTIAMMISLNAFDSITSNASRLAKVCKANQVFTHLLFSFTHHSVSLIYPFIV